MYIELFLLDNIVMDALVLRLAAAVCSVPLRMGRLALFSSLGAVAALLSAWLPGITTVWGKLLSGGALALALSPRSAREYLRALASTFASAYLAGGLVLSASLAMGGGIAGNAVIAPVPVRCALIAALALSFAPRAVRELRFKGFTARARLAFSFRGKDYRMNALVDSGSALREPLTGLPVIVVNAPELAECATIPVAAKTAGGTAVLFALAPCDISVNGRAREALIAPAREHLAGCDALIPQFMLEEAP